MIDNFFRTFLQACGNFGQRGIYEHSRPFALNTKIGTVLPTTTTKKLCAFPWNFIKYCNGFVMM